LIPTTAGTGADQVFGLIMCFAERNATQCVLRYSAAPMRAVAVLGEALAVKVTVPGMPLKSDDVRSAWVPLMSRLTGGVASSPLRIANDSVTYSNSQAMYGLAQCTRDLNASECSRCISRYTDELGKQFASPNYTGGAIKGYTCYLIYQVGGGLDITLPQAVAPPPESNPGQHVFAPHLLGQLVSAQRKD
jgi:hypothetical protein